MSTLKRLGIRKNWLYEIVITSVDNHVPHAAPFGIRTADFKIVSIEMYKGSNTLRNILKNKEFVINTVSDPTVFYHALYAGEKINFGSAKMIKAPVLLDSPASIEVRLKNAVSSGKRYMIEAEVVYLHIRNQSELINRAKSLVLESLILATRISHSPKRTPEELLKENYRVIKKVAPGSKYEHVMQDLLKKCIGV